MTNEEVRLSLNKFLKMYFNACREVYDEINFERITGTQFKYLKAIHKKQEITLTELAEMFHVSKPSMNEVITKFLSSNLVAKKPSENDKRSSYIYLTETGKLLATTNMLESQRAVKKILEKLSEEEVATLTSLFNQFGDETT